MSTKKVIIISTLITVVAGTALWFFWFRKIGGLSPEDRDNLKGIQIIDGTSATTSISNSSTSDIDSLDDYETMLLGEDSDS